MAAVRRPRPTSRAALLRVGRRAALRAGTVAVAALVGAAVGIGTPASAAPVSTAVPTALAAAVTAGSDCRGNPIPAGRDLLRSTVDGVRHTRLQPYTASSPANHPIGSGARYESATATRTAAFLRGNPQVNCDRWSYSIVVATEADPLVTLTNVSNGVVRRVRIPANAQTTEGTDKPMSILQPDGFTLIEGYKMAKVSDTAWTSTYVVVNDLRTDGLSGGARASGISQVIGIVRPHEVATLDIPHPLAVAIPDSMLAQGPVWPARREDGNAATAYSGVIPMGTLLAIPPTVDVTRLGLSPEGVALGRALQDYGAYVLLRASTVALFVEPTSDGAAVARMRTDWAKLYTQVRVVTNSSATSVGGGGTPRQPLAAPLTTAALPNPTVTPIVDMTTGVAVCLTDGLVAPTTTASLLAGGSSLSTGVPTTTSGATSIAAAAVELGAGADTRGAEPTTLAAPTSAAVSGPTSATSSSLATAGATTGTATVTPAPASLALPGVPSLAAAIAGPSGGTDAGPSLSLSLYVEAPGRYVTVVGVTAHP